MAQWIFLEDSGLQQDEHQGINLDFVTNFSLRIDDARLVLFYGGRSEPHALTFKSKEFCQAAYDRLKNLLQDKVT